MRKASGKSIIEVGRLANVAFSTAARALRNDPRISRETTLKVYQAAYKLGYIQKRKNLHPLIGIFMLPISSGMQFNCFESYSVLAREILKRGWCYDIFAEAHPKHINERFLSGAVNIWGGDDIAWNANFPQPLITCNSYKQHFDNVYTIAEDGVHDMEISIDHLWSLGHRRIGLLMDHSPEDSQEFMKQRCKAFLQAMRGRGIEKPEENILFNKDDAMPLQIENLLNKGVTAIIVAAGLLGLQVYTELLKKGLQIPRDISLITWEIPSVSENLCHPITTMEQNYSNWACAVCDLFEAVWSGKTMNHSIFIRGNLIIRETCAEPKQS